MRVLGVMRNLTQFLLTMCETTVVSVFTLVLLPIGTKHCFVIVVGTLIVGVLRIKLLFLIGLELLFESRRVRRKWISDFS